MANVLPAIRKIVDIRAQSRCELCRTTGDMNIHHRKPRQMGGSRMAWLNEPENLLMLCGSGTTGCHGWIESHRTDGYHFGWLLRTGSLPHLTPFCDLYGNWNLLIGHDKLPINMPCGELPKPEYQTTH